MPIINGASIPANRCEEFEIALKELASKHHVELPVEFNAVAGVYDVFPLLDIDSVSDKQRIFKLLTEYAALVDKCGVLLRPTAQKDA